MLEPVRIARSSVLHLSHSLVAGEPALQVSFWAALPVGVAAAMLIAPQGLLSREMTWDLLFNLGGAWHMQHGHVPHVDFHTPFGRLTFFLTYVGFWIVGPAPQAVLISQFLVLVPLFFIASVVASRRLPLLPAVVFVVYAMLLVLMPTNVGDIPNAYSLAMSYNRWGWSALTILLLLLFADPAQKEDGAWLDVAAGGLLLLFLFYLKVTSFMAGVGALLSALVLSRHVRRDWQLWAGVIALTMLNVFLPYNRAYLSDIWTATTSGYLRAEPGDLVVSFLTNKAEYAILCGGVLFLVWLWMRRHASITKPLGAVVVLVLGLFVLSQNSQAGEIPVGIVIFFVIYQVLRQSSAEARSSSGANSLVPIIVLVWPLVGIAAQATMVAGYSRAAMRDDRLVRIETTNLRGLAVPADARDLAEAVARTNYQVLSTLRDPPLRFSLTQSAYVQTLLEAAALFAGEREPVRILVLDQVNAMPFVLGFPPPRGGELWLWPQNPARAAEEVFGDVDVVLVPKYSTLARSTIFAITTYGDYLSRTFPTRQESASWTILRRSHPLERRPTGTDAR
jgi:hypothetical protein